MGEPSWWRRCKRNAEIEEHERAKDINIGTLLGSARARFCATRCSPCPKATYMAEKESGSTGPPLLARLFLVEERSGPFICSDTNTPSRTVLQQPVPSNPSTTFRQQRHGDIVLSKLSIASRGKTIWTKSTSPGNKHEPKLHPNYCSHIRSYIPAARKRTPNSYTLMMIPICKKNIEITCSTRKLHPDYC